MHYYRFNIQAWVQATRGLLPEEEAVYLRLVNHYYDTEAPIPVEYRRVLKRLELLSYTDIVDEILADYFVLTDKGWKHKHCDGILQDFRKRAKKNKDNGMKGGRPRKTKALSETENKPTGLIEETEQKPDGVVLETLTTNDKRLTNKKNSPGIIPGRSPVKKSKFKSNTAQKLLATEIFNLVKTLNPSMKDPNLDSWGNTIRLMVEQDKRILPEIRELFAWANKHDFWHQNILSPESLRKQWDKVTVQRKAALNGGGRKLTLPRDDEALIDFAKKHGLPGTMAGESFIGYRNRLSAALELKTK